MRHLELVLLTESRNFCVHVTLNKQWSVSSFFTGRGIQFAECRMCVGHARYMVIFSPSLLPIHRQYSRLIEKRKHMIQYKVTAEGGGRYRVQVAFPAHVFPFPFPCDTLNQQRTKKAGVSPNFISMLSQNLSLRTSCLFRYVIAIEIITWSTT